MMSVWNKERANSLKTNLKRMQIRIQMLNAELNTNTNAELKLPEKFCFIKICS